VGERKKRKDDVISRIETEIVANAVDVGAKIVVREHHALGSPVVPECR